MRKGIALAFLGFRLSTRLVQSFMAVDAQGDQIRVVIRALLATQLLVMDLHVLSGTTDLASPAIATQNLFSQLLF